MDLSEKKAELLKILCDAKRKIKSLYSICISLPDKKSEENNNGIIKLQSRNLYDNLIAIIDYLCGFINACQDEAELEDIEMIVARFLLMAPTDNAVCDLAEQQNENVANYNMLKDVRCRKLEMRDYVLFQTTKNTLQDKNIDLTYACLGKIFILIKRMRNKALNLFFQYSLAMNGIVSDVIGYMKRENYIFNLDDLEELFPVLVRTQDDIASAKNSASWSQLICGKSVSLKKQMY